MIPQITDPFSAFDTFVPLFSQENEQFNIVALQFLEELVVSKIENDNNKFVIRTATKDVLKESQRESLNATVLGFSAVVVDAGNTHDLKFSRDTIIECSNKDFRDFTYNVCKLARYDRKSFIGMLLCRYLRGKVADMFEVTRRDPIFTVGRRNIAYAYLRECERFINERFAQTKDQRIQIHELVGASGIGKTRAVSGLKKILSALLPSVPMEDLVYTRANDYWWNGYKGQPIVLYDDFTHVKTKLKFDLHFELIAVASGTFRNPPMAFTKDMPFTSSLVIVTSNIPVITQVSTPETVSALKRRIVSGQWTPRSGLVIEENGVKRYVMRGNFVNTICCGTRSVFSLFKESVEIFNESITYDVQIEGFDWESIPCTSAKLTSSVPESHSAMIAEGGASFEAVGFGVVNTTAQVNQELDRGSMLSGVATMATSALSLFSRPQATPKS